MKKSQDGRKITKTNNETKTKCSINKIIPVRLKDRGWIFLKLYVKIGVKDLLKLLQYIFQLV